MPCNRCLRELADGLHAHAGSFPEVQHLEDIRSHVVSMSEHPIQQLRRKPKAMREVFACIRMLDESHARQYRRAWGV